MVQMIISAPGEQPLPAVAWNYEEVKAEVEASLAQYKDRAYTPETIGGAKADRAALNKLADVLGSTCRIKCAAAWWTPCRCCATWTALLRCA